MCSGECKNESESITEEIMEEEKKVAGILLDTTTYSGSSFEISKDMDQEEEATAANVTCNLSVPNDGEGRLIHV
jgi:hypothetical protein